MSEKDIRTFKAISPDTLKVVEFEIEVPRELEIKKSLQHPHLPKGRIFGGLKRIFLPIARHPIISLVTAIIVVIAILGIIYAPDIKKVIQEVIMMVVQEREEVEKMKEETKETKILVEQKIKEFEKASEAGKVKEQKELDEAMQQAFEEQKKIEEEKREKENLERSYKLWIEINEIRMKACIENQMQSGKTTSTAEKNCEEYIQKLYGDGGIK